ncbi:unnamed protein product [Ectocarpus sp. 13 AM-2016]
MRARFISRLQPKCTRPDGNDQRCTFGAGGCRNGVDVPDSIM